MVLWMSAAMQQAAACDSSPGSWSVPASGDVDVPTNTLIWHAGYVYETVTLTQVDTGADVPITLLPTGPALTDRPAVVIAPDAELAPNTTYEVVGLGAALTFTTGAGPAGGDAPVTSVDQTAIECTPATYGTAFYGCTQIGPTVSVFDVTGPAGVLVVDTGGGTVDEADVLAAENVLFAPFDGSEALELRSTDGPYRFGVLTIDGRWSGLASVEAPAGDPCASDIGSLFDDTTDCGGCNVGSGASGWMAVLGAVGVLRARSRRAGAAARG